MRGLNTKQYLEKYPWREQTFNSSVMERQNGVYVRVCYMHCECSECDTPDEIHRVHWSNLVHDFKGDGSYFCRRCGVKWSMEHMGYEGRRSRARAQADSMSIDERKERSRKSSVTQIALGSGMWSSEAHKKSYYTKKENGTFMRSQLEVDIEEEFGGQHSSPEFKYELDNYWPELKLGIEVDDKTHADKCPGYHYEKQKYFNSLGIKVLHISLSPDAVRRPGYSGWRDLVQAFLDGKVPDNQLIMWDDPYHING